MSTNARASPAFTALTSSFACFLYWSRFGRSGSSRAGIRISFHDAPGVRPKSGKKEGSWPSRRLGGHGPFRGLEAPRALPSILNDESCNRKRHAGEIAMFILFQLFGGEAPCS